MKKRLSLSQIQTLDLDELEALMNTADDPRSIEMILKRMDEIDPPDPEAEERDQQLMDALMERRRCFLIAEERCSQYEEAHGKGGVCTVSDEEYLHAKQVWLRGEEIRRRISDTECSWFIHTFEQKRRKRERKMLISALAAAVLIFALGVMAAFRLSKKPHGFFGPGSVFFFVLLF